MLTLNKIYQITWFKLPIAYKGVILALSSSAGFSAKAIFVKMGFLYGANPNQLLMLRMLMALPFFLCLLGRAWQSNDLRKLDQKGWIAIFGLGLLGYYLTSLFDFIGLQYISSGLERLTLFLYPTLVLFISSLIFKKRFSKKIWLAALMAYAGASLAMIHELNIAGDKAQLAIGVAWVLGSALTYAIYIIGSGCLLKVMPSGTFAGLATSIACFAVIVHFLIVDDLSLLWHLDARVYLSCFAMALFSTVLPVVGLNYAIQSIGAESASSISTIGPIFTICLGVWVLNETMSSLQILGAVIVVGSVILIAKEQKKMSRNASYN